MLRRLVVALCMISAASLAAAPKPNAVAPIDVVVYGGTASGVITAYSAAREGLHVRLLEPGGHLGGMVTGGLSATDLGNFHIIGGYARDFYLKAAAHYGVKVLESTRDWHSDLTTRNIRFCPRSMPDRSTPPAPRIRRCRRTTSA